MSRKKADGAAADAPLTPRCERGAVKTVSSCLRPSGCARRVNATLAHSLLTPRSYAGT